MGSGGGGCSLIAALLGGGWYWRSRAGQTLTEKDSILLADFVNTTGDPVFDGTLKQALAVQLEQSPYLEYRARSDGPQSAAVHGAASR